VKSKNDFALVRKPSSAVEKIAPRAKRILSGMVADTLALATRNLPSVTAARSRIGEYEWCEPDYRQILIWAKRLAINPSEVIERLRTGRKLTKDFWGETSFFKGRLLKINWDFDLLPLQDFEWVEHLVTTHLSFYPGVAGWPANRTFRVDLPELTDLACSKLGIVKFDTSKTPKLERLLCAENQLTELNLLNVPNLTLLNCCQNQITRLNLSGVPRLEALACDRNKLPGLDLFSIPNLRELYCRKNAIVELDLSQTPRLEKLDCYENPIEYLDIRPMREITFVHVPKTTKVSLPINPKLVSKEPIK